MRHAAGRSRSVTGFVRAPRREQLGQVTRQFLRRRLYQHEDVGKGFVLIEIRIGNLRAVRRPGVEGTQQPDPVARIRPAWPSGPGRADSAGPSPGQDPGRAATTAQSAGPGEHRSGNPAGRAPRWLWDPSAPLCASPQCPRCPLRPGRRCPPARPRLEPPTRPWANGRCFPCRPGRPGRAGPLRVAVAPVPPQVDGQISCVKDA